MPSSDAFITLDDKRLEVYLKTLRATLGPAGVDAVFNEVGKDVAKIFEFRYPKQSNSPLEKRYLWPDGQFHKFKSIKAQRGFFAALSSGRIDVPYKRTGRLADSFKYKFTTNGQALNVKITVPQKGKFNPNWLLGVRQSRYFAKRSFWQPLLFMMDDRKPAFIDAIEKAFQKVFRTKGLL